MSHELRDGVQIEALTWPDDSELRVGRCGVTEIVCAPQIGHMAAVATWAMSTNSNGTRSLINLDHVSIVELRKGEGDG